MTDYRDLTGRFDRIVSVGMFEHVGARYYPQFFAKVREVLADDGVMLLHTIGRADGPGATNAWIRKYIFPGGYAPALSEIAPVIEKAGLFITDVEVLRLHYAKTLSEWQNRFQANRAEIEALYDERFCRMWEFYLAGRRDGLPSRKSGGVPDPDRQARRCLAAHPRLHEHRAATPKRRHSRSRQGGSVVPQKLSRSKP